MKLSKRFNNTNKTSWVSAIFLIVIYFFSTQSLFADPKPKVESQNNKKAGKTEKKSSLKQIDELWMKEIKKDKSKINENTKAVSNQDQDPKTTRLANPGDVEQTQQGLFPKSEAPSFFSVLIRFIGLMTFFIGGFYLLIQFMKKRGKGAFLNHNNGLVEVILSVPLVQGKFLQIVDIAGTLMVLGVSDTGIQQISQIEDGRTADKIRLWQSKKPETKNPMGLLDTLTNMFRESDFKFWSDKNAKQPSFEDVLNKEIPTRIKTKNNIDEQSVDLFTNQKDKGSVDQNGIDEIGNMLKKHERKLKALKKK